MLWLAPLLLAATPASAYSFTFLRSLRPNFFHSPNYLLTTSALTTRIPGECYPLDGHTDLGAFDVAVIYNRPGETPITGLAAYTNQQCGQTSARPPMKPAFTITLDPDNLYGIHLVRLADLGIEYTVGSVRGISVPDEERPGGLLDGAADLGTPISAVYVWEGEPTDRIVPRRRVYLPDVVERVSEPTGLLEVLGDTIEGAVYLQDLVERYLLPLDAAPIEDVVTPWMQQLVAGEFDNLQILPLLRGPLYDPERDTGQQEMQQPVDGDTGRSTYYPLLIPGTVPGMVYEAASGENTANVIQIQQQEEAIPLQRGEDDTDVIFDPTLNAEFQTFLSGDQSPLEEQPLLANELLGNQQLRRPAAVPVEELQIEYPPIPQLQRQQPQLFQRIPQGRILDAFRMPPPSRNRRYNDLSNVVVARPRDRPIGRLRLQEEIINNNIIPPFNRAEPPQARMEEDPQPIRMNIEQDANDEASYYTSSPNARSLLSQSNLPSPQQNGQQPWVGNLQSQNAREDIDLGNRILLEDVSDEAIDNGPWGMTSTVRRPQNVGIPGLQQQRPGMEDVIEVPVTSTGQQRDELDLFLAEDGVQSGSQESVFPGLNPGTNSPRDP
ncbi:hypothetical protein Dda_9264 [Drechslerella dactyloides]|uniref:Uncharacterized protein n=1 Tax=Drechslerella dactyloides TaxID=74499 RepID=A0AAD6NEJ5_DREDA|nr:hypothetical protein Dda_9264 [Drechslerella dactyloides]